MNVPPEPTRKFVLFGGLHLFILFTMVALPAAMSWLTRRRERPLLARGLAWGLVAVLLVNRVMAVAWGIHEHRIPRWVDALPMHLCDWASAAVIVALLGGGQLAYELAYFWGLSGTFQAVLTPDVADTPASPFFVGFFVDHCGIIVGVLFLTWGLHRRPRRDAVWRVLLWNQVYLVCAGSVNWIFHANYGYLSAKPQHSSLLDYFGPWPWYILTLEALALVFYTAFYLPFWVADRRLVATPKPGPVRGQKPLEPR